MTRKYTHMLWGILTGKFTVKYIILPVDCCTGKVYKPKLQRDIFILKLFYSWQTIILCVLKSGV